MSDAIVKHDLNALVQVASALGDAGDMLPSHINSKGEALAVIMAGAELGLPPMASLRGLHLVKGKVGLDYATMVGLLRRAGYKVQWTEKTDTRAELLLTHHDGTTHTEVWDIARAKKAGLWGQKGPWTSYPEAMLSARCVSSAARAFAGDVLAGCYSMDEVRDIRGDVHEAEDVSVIPREQTYDDPQQAAEKDRVRAVAEGFSAEVLPGLEEAISGAVEEVTEAGDDEQELAAIVKGNTAAMRTWFETHGARYLEVCAHPAATNEKSKVWRRLQNWAKAAGIPVSDVAAFAKASASLKGAS